MLADAHISSLRYLCCYRAFVKLNSGHVPALLALQYTKKFTLQCSTTFLVEGGERETLNLPFRALLQTDFFIIWRQHFALMDQGAFMVSISCCVQLLPFILVLHGGSHRRTRNFLPGGAVNHLPQKVLASVPNFYKRVEKKRGPYCNNIGRTGV